VSPVPQQLIDAAAAAAAAADADVDAVKIDCVQWR